MDKVGLQMERDPKRYNVRAVERAVRILSSFGNDHAEQSVTQIAQATGLPKATAHRITMTLFNSGFLERTGDGEQFRLGLRMVGLGLGALRRLDIRRAAQPYMQKLVADFGENCTLGVFDRGQVFYVEVEHSSHSLTIGARVGRHLPAHCTASGKALLAFLPPEAVQSVLSLPLAAYTAKTITSPDQLREELKAIRQRGYALADEEFEEGIWAISAPIRDIDGNVLAALGLPFPTNRLRRNRIPEIAQALLEATDAVSALVQARVAR